MRSQSGIKIEQNRIGWYNAVWDGMGWNSMAIVAMTRRMGRCSERKQPKKGERKKERKKERGAGAACLLAPHARKRNETKRPRKGGWVGLGWVGLGWVGWGWVVSPFFSSLPSFLACLIPV